MKDWILFISAIINLVLLGVVVFLNDRYGLWAKIQRVTLEEGRVPGVAASYELNRNYQVRREMFRLDKNEDARVLMLGDSLTAQGEWNAMLGEPLVANRGIDGDTSAGVLARIGDDADFGGDAVVIWIGTNDVLQGGAAGSVALRIMEAARGKADPVSAGTGREDCQRQPKRHPGGEGVRSGDCNMQPFMGEMSGSERVNIDELERTRQILKSEKLKVGRPAADSGGLIADGEAASQPRTDGGEVKAVGGASLEPSMNSGELIVEVNSPTTSYPLLATVPEAQVFVLGIPPIAKWWEGARERNETIREINARLAEGAQENGYRFIELESVLADENGFLRGEMTSDGVHLRAQGYMALIQRLKKVGLWPAAED